MKKMKKLFALVMAVAMIMGLAACGSSGDSDVPTYKVLTNATFPPFDTIDEETGEIVDMSATPKFYKGASVTPVY